MRVVNYRTNERVVAALVVSVARKWTTIIYMDDKVVCRKVKNSDEKYMKPLLYKGKDYPVSRAVRQFKAAGKRIGITRTATRALQGR